MASRSVARLGFGLAGLLVGIGLGAAGAAPQQPANLARLGTARSWLPNSRPTAPTALATDGDPLTFWGSNEPTTDPPKDIGVEWAAPQTFTSVVARFYSLGYVPARDGWKLEALADGHWRKLNATAHDQECEWWSFRFPPVKASAVRLVVTAYQDSRPAISEFEVYAGAPPEPKLRRPARLDGAFWSFHYEPWASHYTTDAMLAAEADAAHRIGLNTIILYSTLGQHGVFSTVVPDTALPQSAAWAGRDPIEAILAAADRLGMRVYLGDCEPAGFLAPPTADKKAAVHDTLYRYREQVLRRCEKHRSLVGYYANYECIPDDYDNDPARPARYSEEVAAFVKGVCPRLRVVQPVGLYNWRDTKQDAWHLVTPRELERFWRPFIAAAKHVDAFMVIDGVGTGLAPLNYTGVNQARIRTLCHELGKEMWTDVEIAEMGRRYQPMPIGRVVPSLKVAARHCRHMVAFDYVSYMAPGNGRESSRRLYEEYRAYLAGLARP